MTTELQFGFKAKCSNNMCSLVLKETLLQYSTNESSVYCTLLDATKAIDQCATCIVNYSHYSFSEGCILILCDC